MKPGTIVQNQKPEQERHRPHLFHIPVILLWAILAVVVLFIVFHSENTSLSIPAPAFISDQTEAKVKLKSYSAEKLSDLLYTDAGTAMVKDGRLTYTWQIPDEYKERDTYTELCIETPNGSGNELVESWCSGGDSATGSNSAATGTVTAESTAGTDNSASSDSSDETTYQTITCTYYVPNNSRGLIADLFNWNELDENQQVGCPTTSTDSDGSQKYASYIDAFIKIENNLYSAITVDNGSSVIIPNTSDETATVSDDASDSTVLTIEDITKIVQQAINNNTNVYVGPQGEQGLKGDKGDIGEKGEKGDPGEGVVCEGGQDCIGLQGPQGLAGPQGEKGDKGDAGEKGEKGDTGAKGEQGDPGVKGDTGSPGAKGDTGEKGDPGIATVTGGGLILTNQALSLTACAEGQVLKTLSGTWACAPDNNTVTTDSDTKYNALANGGLILDASNNFSLMTCTDAQILKWNGTTSRWECSTDQNTTYDLTGYLQIANLQTELNNLTPGYYTKTQVDSLLNNLITTIPAGGLKVPKEIATESSLTISSCTAEGDYFFVQDMDATAPGHTGRAWCYDDNGTMKLYKVYDEYMTPDSTTVMLNNGLLSVNTTWLDTYLNNKNYATNTDLTNAIAAIDFTPYIKKTDIPTCSTGQVITSTAAGILTCVQDQDTTTPGGTNLLDGNVAGQMLHWDGTAWALTGNSGSQTLDFVTAGNVTITGGLDMTNAVDGLKDYYGQTGNTGDRLAIDGSGNLKWMSNGSSLPSGTRTGQALIWNGTDWTAGEAISIDFAGTEALNIKDGSTNTAFNVDTVNRQVAIGGGDTADQIPFALVLDSFGDTTSADPPTLAINGAMYYNSDKGKFRCYENNAWKDCIGGTGTSSITVNYIPTDTNGNITLDAHDVGTYTDDEIDQKIDEELTFEYLHAPISAIDAQTTSIVAPAAYHASAYATAGEYLYTFAGMTTSLFANSYRYSLLTGQSSQIANYPAGPTRDAMATSDGTYIYVFGGSSSSTTSRNTAYRYDPGTNTYSQLANLPVTVGYGGATYYDGKIYIIGGCTSGWSNTSVSRNLIIYDIASDSYTTVTNFLPMALHALNVRQVGGTVFIIGGRGASNNIVGTLYSADLAQPNPSVMTLASMPINAAYGAVYSDTKRIYMTGGWKDGGASFSNITQIYDIVTDTWQTSTISNTPARSHVAYGQYGNTLWVFGGYNGASVNIVNRINFNSQAIAYLKVGERYNLTVTTYTDVDVEDSAGNIIAANTIIPAGTEIVARADTRVFLNENLTTEGSWIRRGGAGGPIQIGVITPTVWTDDVVKKNGETWLKMNGQTIDPTLYPALNAQINSAPQAVSPIMTNNTTPAPYKTSASSYWGTAITDAFTAADGVENVHGWVSGANTMPGGVGNDLWQIDFGSQTQVDAFYIVGRETAHINQNPVDFTLLGSNDGTNWVPIQSYTGLSWATSYETKNFTLGAPTNYRHYRISITKITPANTSTGQYDTSNLAEVKFFTFKNTLPNYGTNPQGQYYYIKADGYTNNGYTITDGYTSGQVLTWDGTLSQWVAGNSAGTGGSYNFGDGLTLDTATDTVSIAYIDEATGDFTFKNADGDTTASFRVTNSADSTAFNIDTVNNQVAIGNGATADQIPFALVLDSFGDTTSADPATLAINGAMYYNTDKNKFRCYENNAWKDCIGGTGTSSVTVNYIPADTNGNIALGANDVNAYSKDETDQKIDEELTFEYLPETQVYANTQFASTNRTQTAATSLGEKLYYFGGAAGLNYSSITNTAYAYDMRTSTYTTLAVAPVSQRGGTAVSDGSRYIYLLWSYNGSTDVLTNHRYDTVTNTYTPIASRPAGVYIHGHKAAYNNGKVYLFGYTNVNNTTSNAGVYVYDIATDTWSSSPLFTLPTNVGVRLVADYSDHAYLVFTDSSMALLDYAAMNVTTLVAPGTTEVGAALTAFKGNDYIIFPIANDRALKYTTSSNSWDTINIANYIYSNSANAYGQYDNILVVLGSYANNNVNAWGASNRVTINDNKVLAYLRVGEKIYANGAMRSDVPINCGNGNTTNLPADTECTALADTRIYPTDNITAGWIRRGGAGGPIQIGVITPTMWTDGVVKKNGETWLKMNGQEIDPEEYPALLASSNITHFSPPAMTSDTAPAPYVASSSGNYSVYRPYYIFDHQKTLYVSGSGAWVGPAVPAWVQIDLSSAKTISGYTITSKGYLGTSGTTYQPGESPRNWTLQGSNDGSNYTIIDTQTAQTFPTQLYDNHYTLSNPATYRYYRLNIASTNGSNLVTISELNFDFEDVGSINLPNYGTNPQGQYYYIKAAGYTNNGYTVGDGSAGGQVLTWDNTANQWAAGTPSGGSGTNYVFSGGLALDVPTNTVSLSYVDSTTGNFTFKNTVSDTAIAFRIADTADAPVFNVDTASGIVTIGSGAVADAAAVALLLDSSTVAPTNPQNGMMYYDTTLTKFRCYEDDTWKDCISTTTADNLSNRPDLWTAGTEYDFGDGLYGQRFAGTFSQPANAYKVTTLATSWNSYTLVSSGGQVSQNNNTLRLSLNSGRFGASSAIYQTNELNIEASGNLIIFTFDNTAGSANTYDIWVKYTK